jgi:predicted RecB family nuclease
MTAIEITPRNSYFAKSCPQRVQLDVLQPCEPLPDAPFLLKLWADGDSYEEETFASLVEGIAGAVVIDVENLDAREYHTRLALDAGAPVVAGGRLPVDVEAHRVGEPDLLVRHGDGYVPVDVKSHQSLVKPKTAGAGTALVSGDGELFRTAATVDLDHDPRLHLGDLLQLAHYRHLLVAAGFASSANVAGVLGSEGVVVWYDLDVPLLAAPEHLDPATTSLPAGPLSAMQRYDLEFALRLEIHAAAEAHRLDASARLLAEPIVCEQCDLCRWRDWCGDRLEEVADLSLISGVGVARRRLYQSHGIADLHDLAALDWTTAALLADKVDVRDLLARSDGLAPSSLLASVIPKRKKQLESLAAHGLSTVADARALDPAVLALAGDGATNLATQIELARARTGSSPAYRARGVVRLDVPRGDVEVDVDMESTNDGCYLWGALVTDHGAGSASAYLPFVTWDADIERGEEKAFAAFWAWFTDLRARTHADGLAFRAYCYSKNAEETQMRRVAGRLGLLDEVEEFLASDEWVDLLRVTARQLVTGRSMGLKETAPLAGFAWRADDAGGTQAMVAYDTAVDEEDPIAQGEAQGFILEYNEDDVRATAALREWLDGPANDLPCIAEWVSCDPDPVLLKAS